MPRKTQGGPPVAGQIHLASMRPRPDAAENADVRIAVSPAAAASMRPRPDAAENTRRRSRAPPR